MGGFARLGRGRAMVEMFIGLGIVVVGIALIFKGWSQIYRAQAENELVTEGIYRYMRHPQYTGIYLALVGQLIHWPTLPTLVFFPLIDWLYYHLAQKEEQSLMNRFGQEFENWIV